MISKKYIKSLEFDTLEEFFNYVLESKINGNYKQTKEFIKKMSKEQFLYFLDYLGTEPEQNNIKKWVEMRLTE